MASAVFDTDEEASLQYERLRGDVGANDAVFDDILAEKYFVESLSVYPNDTAKMLAHARVIALRRIRASAAMLGRYAQNQSEEDLTKVFDNLTVQLNEWRDEVDKAADPIDSSTAAPFFFGTARGRRGL